MIGRRPAFDQLYARTPTSASPTSPYITLTRRRPYASGHSSHQRPITRPRPHAQLLPLTGHAGPTEASVRSLTVTSFRLLFFTELILINSNFFSFANVPTPPSVHHHVMCVSFSHTFPKVLATQLAMPLDPSNDVKLDHSSGIR